MKHKLVFQLSTIFVGLFCLVPAAQQEASAASQSWGTRGMVVSAHALASKAGLETLKAGGNAVDAAVATTFAISVVEPQSAGIGGGGFLLFREGRTGDIKALDFRERAPLASTRMMYLDAKGKVRPKASTDGYLAVAVPGTVAGLWDVHHLYGRLPWKTVVEPAIKLANQGFLVSPKLASAIAQQKTLQQNPAAQKIFTQNGKPLSAGNRLIQPDLGKTLDAIAVNPQSFYAGAIAQAIAMDMKANGGLITLQDLKQYRPIWREPVCGAFRKARICSMPPPSSGGVHLLQMLNMIGGSDLKALGWHHPDALHLMIETMRIAYADRAQYLGDPDFVKVPVSALMNPAYAQQRRQEIDLQKARSSSQVQAVDPKTLKRFNTLKESNDTSHLGIVDEAGNAVSLTFTVNLSFGAGVVANGTGIVLNDEMDDFAAAPGVANAFGLVGSEANAIAPGKTPLSSMTPTIVTENGQLKMVVGSPGGSRIITTVLQIILNVMVYEMDIRRAVAAPRIHHQWLPDTVMAETRALDPLTLEELRQRGHQIEDKGFWSNANAIFRNPNGFLEGTADPRGEGAAFGY